MFTGCGEGSRPQKVRHLASTHVYLEYALGERSTVTLFRSTHPDIVNSVIAEITILIQFYHYYRH